MREFLILRLYGPLAAWGQVAVGEVRPSDLSPTRSALLGLVAAALGLRRDDEDALEQLSDALHFAVRSDRLGVPLRDYHTVQTGKPARKQTFFTRRDELAADKVKTVVSQRYHRCDGAWTAIAWLSEGSPWSLTDLEEALRNPVFTLYLGRKSCPLAWPLDPRRVTASTVTEALEQAPSDPWQEHLEALPQPPKSSPFLSWDVEDEAAVGEVTKGPGVREVQRRDQPVSRRGWLFAQRWERSAALPGER